MNKKIICISIVSMFLMTSIVSLTAFADESENEDGLLTTNERTEDILEQLYALLENHGGIKISPVVKQVIQKALDGSSISGPLPPGLYEFDPCNDIDIQGKGIWVSEEEEQPPEQPCFLFSVIEAGQVDIDHFSGEFTSNEIWAIIIFDNFTGDLMPEVPPDPLHPADIAITGSAEYGVLIEFSWLVKADSKKDSYRWGRPVTTITKNTALEKIDIVNPHFYVFNDDFELVYDEEIKDTWTLGIGDSKLWEWDQKDNDGNQVPKGDYLVYGEFSINDRTHPAGTSSFYIKGKNEGIAKQQFIQTLELLMSRFPLFARFLNLQIFDTSLKL